MTDFRNLKRLEQGIQVSLLTDEEGFTGRQCPNADCRGYFKVTFGTGLKGENLPCHCPYCGHTTSQSDFFTSDQAEYLKSVIGREYMKALHQDMKGMEFEIKSKGPFGIGMSMKLEPLHLQPVHWYREKKLETHIECSNCTLKYAVYGVFAFCPDCGQHNSLQILDKNLELAIKMLDMAATAEADVAKQLIENALEDCVSSFDGFGREICRVHAKKSTDPAKAEKMSFQNLDGAKQNLIDLFGIYLAAGLAVEEWKATVRGFRKRHLLSHKMGVVDDEYIRKSGDARAIVGRKVFIGSDEVRELSQLLNKLAQSIAEEFRGLP
jgi:hypothetical protein